MNSYLIRVRLAKGAATVTYEVEAIARTGMDAAQHVLHALGVETPGFALTIKPGVRHA